MPKILIASSTALTLFVMGAIGAAADGGPFLCPVMGEGALSAPGLNSQSVNTVGPLPSGNATIVPGNNQAGANANPTAYNQIGGPTAPNNVPGTPGFTPIWPHP